MAVSRRGFIRNSLMGSAAGLAAAPLLGCGGSGSDAGQPSRVSGPILDPENPFKHGVASGDPTQTSAIIWTRVTQEFGADEEAESSVMVTWAVFADPAKNEVLASGNAIALPENDYCVKVDVDGLEPYTAYYYEFSALGYESVMGRVQTMPDWPADSDRRLRIAVVSCANYAYGYFHVYRDIAKRNDIDFVVHLGDYIYEYADGRYGDLRNQDPPHDLVTLDDYRRRHALYKADPDLAELHRQYAFINIWDDHEIADNASFCGAANHREARAAGLSPEDEAYRQGYWQERKSRAIKAFFEWLPIRPAADDVDMPGQVFAPKKGKIWRTFTAGDFADFVMLDTRLWKRDEGSRALGFTAEDARDYQSTDNHCEDSTAHRDMVGPDQEDWLHQRLRRSSAKWKVIGNQVLMSHLRIEETSQGEVPEYVNGDAWDGYPTTQEGLYNVLLPTDDAAEPVDNVVVLTGDLHSSWALDVTADPDRSPYYEALAIEVVTPSVTSPSFGATEEILDELQSINPHLKYLEIESRGWVLLDLTAEQATAEWYYISSALVDLPDDPGRSRLGAVCCARSEAGKNGLQFVSTDITRFDKQTRPTKAYVTSRPPKAP